MGAANERQPRVGEVARPSSRLSRAGRTAGGVALIAGGTLLLFLPGPGVLLIATGVALLPGGRRKLVRARELVQRRYSRVTRSA